MDWKSEKQLRVEGKNRNILRLIRTELALGIPVGVVFLSTDDVDGLAGHG
ncbi:hypothetical protein [Paenibacillus ferrarius]|nr:hypothetical protein [Paenibacillus ferrarius]